MFWIPLLIMAASAVAQGNAAKKQGQFNARVQARNAAVARDQAAAEIARQRIAARKTIGSMRAAYAASGVTVEGSPLDVLEESAAAAELDTQTLRYRGELRAQGAEIGASLENYKGNEAQRAGWISAAGTIFGGFGNNAAQSTK